MSEELEALRERYAGQAMAALITADADTHASAGELGPGRET